MRTISGYFPIGSTDQRTITRFRRTGAPTGLLTHKLDLPDTSLFPNVGTVEFIPHSEGLHAGNLPTSADPLRGDPQPTRRDEGLGLAAPVCLLVDEDDQDRSIAVQDFDSQRGHRRHHDGLLPRRQLAHPGELQAIVIGERPGDDRRGSPFVVIEPGEVIGKDTLHGVTDLAGHLRGGPDVKQRTVAGRRRADQRVGLAVHPSRGTERDQHDPDQRAPDWRQPPEKPGMLRGSPACGSLLPGGHLRQVGSWIVQRDRRWVRTVLG
jgi:hypothetical protein